MPKIRRGQKEPPEGWELIEPTLTELGKKMRDGKDF
jgi:bud site selection protein 31